MRKKLLSDEQEKFFLAHQIGQTRDGIAQLMNDTFGLQLSVQQISDLRSSLHVNAGKIFAPRPGRRIFTAEQEEFFKANQHGLLLKEIAQLMNDTFGLQLSAQQMKDQRRRLKLTAGPAKLYMKRAKKNSGQFGENHRPYNRLPVGAEVIRHDGYLWRKIAEPNKWKQVHILLWEKAHGPLQKGEKLTFLNGDRTDIRLENLAQVTCSINSILTSKKLRFADAELTRAGINVAMLIHACGQKERGRK